MSGTGWRTIGWVVAAAALAGPLQAAGSRNVQVALVAETNSSIEPGQPLHLGFRLEMAEAGTSTGRTPGTPACRRS